MERINRGMRVNLETYKVLCTQTNKKKGALCNLIWKPKP